MNACVLMTDEELDRLGREPSGFGNLETVRGRLPLTALTVQARIVALVAELELSQTFKNTLAEPIEATYIFPLPDRAAVTRFQMEANERRIEGVIDERGRARVNYEQAIAAGHTAAIAEEDRPGVFTLRVGNIMPGASAVVRLTLVGPLPFEDGEASFVFPLVVAPRYIPGIGLPGPQAGSGSSRDTDATPDASRITPPLLLPGFPNPVQLNIEVDLDGGGVPLRNLRSSLHAVTTTHDGAGYKVSVQPGEHLNRDFILRWRLGDGQVRSTAVLVPDADGEEATCLVTVVPPQQDATTKPRDVVFVLDRSGSMGGWKMVAARRAVARMVDTLGAQDRFAVLAFDNAIEMPPTLPQNVLTAASDRHRFRAVEFLSGVDARGGTELLEPLQLAAKLLSGGDGSRDRSLILVTDGQVGNEDQILRELSRRVQQVRVFTLGIDRAVNAAFLRRLAGLGGGACELVESEDRLDEVMGKVHRRIGQPVVTNLQLQGDGVVLQPDSLAPSRLPDLFAGAPLLVAARIARGAQGSIVIGGQTPSGRPWTQTVPLFDQSGDAAAAVWARARIRDLEDCYVTRDGNIDQIEQQIIAISLRHRVLSRFTAFLAVDRSARVNPGGHPLEITQSVESPEGWGEVAECARTVDFDQMKCMLEAAPAGGSAVAGSSPPSMRSRGAPAPAAPPSAAPPAPKSAKKAAAPTPSLLSRRMAKEEKEMTEPEPAIDLAPYLQRVRDLADAIEAAGIEAAPELIDRLLARLLELVEDMHSVQQDGGFSEELGKAADALRTVLNYGAWLDIVHDIANDCRLVAERLRKLAQRPPPGDPSSKRAFWK